MICLEDLIALKEQNDKAIEENKIIIADKEKMNIALEAENRVFDKLITVEKEKEPVTADLNIETQII